MKSNSESFRMLVALLSFAFAERLFHVFHIGWLPQFELVGCWSKCKLIDIQHLSSHFSHQPTIQMFSQIFQHLYSNSCRDPYIIYRIHFSFPFACGMYSNALELWFCLVIVFFFLFFLRSLKIYFDIQPPSVCIYNSPEGLNQIRFGERHISLQIQNKFT